MHSRAQKIDVHHHFIPDAYIRSMFVLFVLMLHVLIFHLAALSDQGGDPSGWPTPQWSLSASEDMMARVGAATSILSITAPGVAIAKTAEGSKRLARQINEYAAKLRDEKPAQFGFFATLPSLLETQDAIEEITYALDVLKADGVTVFTRYGDGNYYLGHDKMRPIWEELNRREAVVFIHPTTSVDKNLVNPTMPQPMIDYPHESTRTAIDMIVTGTKRRYPKCKVILSHAGGTLPYLISRVGGMYRHMIQGGMTRSQIEEDAKSFYFDLALSGTKNILGLLFDWAPHDHILFGSDFPYAPSPSVIEITEDLDSYHMDEDLRRNINFENALKLFPRLANYRYAG